jgi:membrane protein required for colicin V production
MLDKLIWVDYGILGILVLSMALSAWRGFIREALSLASWIAALVVAVAFSDAAAGLLVDHVSVPSVRLIIGFAVLFLITLLVGGLLSYLVSTLVDKTGLSGTDRAVGVIFGLVRGVGIVAVLVLLAGLTPVPQDPWWNQSLLLPRFVDLAILIRDLMPAEYRDYFAFG